MMGFESIISTAPYQLDLTNARQHTSPQPVGTRACAKGGSCQQHTAVGPNCSTHSPFCRNTRVTQVKQSPPAVGCCPFMLLLQLLLHSQASPMAMPSFVLMCATLIMSCKLQHLEHCVGCLSPCMVWVLATWYLRLLG
jgi:hypothetical protein